MNRMRKHNTTNKQNSDKIAQYLYYSFINDKVYETCEFISHFYNNDRYKSHLYLKAYELKVVILLYLRLLEASKAY